MAGQKCNKILSELGRVVDYQSPVSKLSMWKYFLMMLNSLKRFETPKISRIGDNFQIRWIVDIMHDVESKLQVLLVVGDIALSSV